MRKCPVATYRIQFRTGFGFEQAIEAIPYLARLGVSHLYASPVFTATKGSSHGYDVCDFNEIDPSLGGRTGFETMCEALRRHGLELLLDIVPNHMAASMETPWWFSVLRLGQASPFAGHFDIDWSRRLTLPVLETPFAEAAAAGKLRLDVDPKGELCLRHYEDCYPLSPESLAIAPGGAEIDLAQRSQDLELMQALHARQAWELMPWPEARRNLSYRRFFEVAGLVGTRVEDPPVFDDIHRLTFELVREGLVQGLRVDHVDGLADPLAYLKRLRASVGDDVWIVVEKILAHGERLPLEWPVDGTTGYEFIDACADLFCDGRGLDRLRNGFAARTGALPPAALRADAKGQIVTINFEGELNRLATLAGRILGRASAAMAQALGELVAAMPVYRTYGDKYGMADRDRQVLEKARANAQTARQELSEDLAAITALLTGSHPSAGGAQALQLRVRFQQLCGPAMAKGVEDTFFYRDAALVALNEVGTSPDRPWPMRSRFHHAMAERARSPCLSLTALSTHDTKRGEDARALVLALTRKPDDWLALYDAAEARTSDSISALQRGPAPEPWLRHFLLQSLAGALGDRSDLAERMQDFTRKATREAKLRTNWGAPNEEYEDAVLAYAQRLTEPDFLDWFSENCSTFEADAAYIAIAQTFVRLLAPGIPDIYQGSERGDWSLVDPDNRRPVDFSGLRDANLDAEPDRKDVARWKQWLTARLLQARGAHPELFALGDYAPLDAGPGAVAFMRRRGNRVAIAACRTSGGDAKVCLPDGLAAGRDMLETKGPVGAGDWSSILSGRPCALVVFET